jgi:hypothetical protein
MARTGEHLTAWAELLELCLDDCQVFSTSKAMRAAIVEVEAELGRLHKIEECAIQIARLFEHHQRFDKADDDNRTWQCLEWMWNDEVWKPVLALIPEAFTDEAMKADWQKRSKELLSPEVAARFSHVEITDD